MITVNVKAETLKEGIMNMTNAMVEDYTKNFGASDNNQPFSNFVGSDESYIEGSYDGEMFKISDGKAVSIGIAKRREQAIAEMKIAQDREESVAVAEEIEDTQIDNTEVPEETVEEVLESETEISEDVSEKNEDNESKEDNKEE